MTFFNLWYVQLLILLLSLLGLKKVGNFDGMEHGSAKWAGKKERNIFSDSKNTITLQDGLYIKPRDSRFKNTHELVVGDTGAYKTYRKIIPDLMQDLGSYVVTTTKADLYTYTTKFLKLQGYKIRVMNLYEPQFSNTYNPFKYITNDTDIDKLVNTFIENSRKQDCNKGDSFWEDTMSMLMVSIVSYLHNAENEVKTFARITDLVVGIEVIKGKIAPYSEYEQLMNELEIKNPYHTAVINYKLFKKSAGETLQSILISLASRLRFWTTEEIRILTHSDEMDIDNIAKEKTVLFIIIPAGDNTYRCISSMLISQLFNRFYHLGDFVYSGEVPMTVNFLLDEFPNIGKIPAFETYITTMRSYNLRASIVVQNLKQLEQLYDKATNTIISNCFIFNYLGCNDEDTFEKISKRLGKTTINEINNSYNRGRQGGRSESERSLARDLMTSSEVGDIPYSHSIVFVGGLKFFGKKFQTEKHELSKYLGYKDNPNNTNIHIEYEDIAKRHKDNYGLYKTSHQKNAIRFSPDGEVFGLSDLQLTNENSIKNEIEQNILEEINTNAENLNQDKANSFSDRVKSR